jgi:hypothetical protein
MSRRLVRATSTIRGIPDTAVSKSRWQLGQTRPLRSTGLLRGSRLIKLHLTWQGGRYLLLEFWANGYPAVGPIFAVAYPSLFSWFADEVLMTPGIAHNSILNTK